MRLETSQSADLATRILVAYLERQTIDLGDLPVAILKLRSALEQELTPSVAVNPAESMAAQTGVTVDVAFSPADAVAAARTVPAASPRTPAVPVEESIQDEYLISLEDGKPYRSLKRHLMAKYKMTPEDYRVKWGLPADYPMVAPSYAQERSIVAKRIGLGRRSPTKASADRRIK